jgi:hypothetical protein
MKYAFAVAAVAVLAASPAFAAKSKKMSCAGDGPAKMMTSHMGSAYTPARIPMDKKLAAMNAAMSKGDMRACNKVMMKK